MNIRLPAVLLAASLSLLCCAPPPPTPTSVPVPPAAVEAYRSWVLDQADRFLTQTEAFAAAIEAGDRSGAQALYAPARGGFERIEPIAEALGDLDARLDAREGDVPAGEWKGYHLLEKVLWTGGDLKAAVPAAQALVADSRLLRARIEAVDLTAGKLVTGAVELLNEISTKKVTGEEEPYSHTDLWDLEANLAGAEAIWQFLSPSVAPADPELAKKIDARFSSLHGLLEVHRKGEGFRLYTDVYPKEVKALAGAVDALAAPLAELGRLIPAE